MDVVFTTRSVRSPIGRCWSGAPTRSPRPTTCSRRIEIEPRTDEQIDEIEPACAAEPGRRRGADLRWFVHRHPEWAERAVRPPPGGATTCAGAFGALVGRFAGRQDRCDG